MLGGGALVRTLAGPSAPRLAIEDIRTPPGPCGPSQDRGHRGDRSSTVGRAQRVRPHAGNGLSHPVDPGPPGRTDRRGAAGERCGGHAHLARYEPAVHRRIRRRRPELRAAPVRAGPGALPGGVRERQGRRHPRPAQGHPVPGLRCPGRRPGPVGGFHLPAPARRGAARCARPLQQHARRAQRGDDGGRADPRRRRGRVPAQRARTHRAPGGDGAGPAERLARRPDRPAQPEPAGAAARPRRPAVPPVGQDGGDHVRRPRPVQVGQRHLWPPHRRRAADRGGGAADVAAAARRHPGAVGGGRVRGAVRGPRGRRGRRAHRLPHRGRVRRSLRAEHSRGLRQRQRRDRLRRCGRGRARGHPPGRGHGDVPGEAAGWCPPRGRRPARAESRPAPGEPEP